MKRRMRDDRGATMVEYGLLLATVVLVVAATVPAFGLAVADLFDVGGLPLPW